MPDSNPNDFGVSGGGDIASQFLLLAGFPTGNKRINWGLANPFINGVESNNFVVSHGLGVIPEVIILGNAYTDNGRFCSFVHTGIPITTTTFGMFVTDINPAIAHGPGTLAAVFPWLVIG